jgi:hypothetical protein
MNIGSGNFVVEPMDLHRHWEGVERLLEVEQWPFVMADFEVSEAQPRAVALVARVDDEVTGFFTAHHFGDTAYLDMMVMHPSRRKDLVMASELLRQAKLRMRRNGFSSHVMHCTRASSKLVRMAGFQPGISFSLLCRDSEPARTASNITPLGDTALDDLIALDAEVFSARRDTWIRTLMQQPSTRFFGLYDGVQLVASVCLRERRENSFCIDACNALTMEPLQHLLDDVVAAHPDKRLECCVKQGSELQLYLEANGFSVPAFFAEIGPLVEYRRGPDQHMGLGPALRTLSWI